jgi:transcriptional regulator with XRE-family HTH domain
MENIAINFNIASLRQAIDNAGISQAELARKAGVRRSAINNILSGSSKPSVEVLAKICCLLNVSMDIFLLKS